jgi:hypothetical protein
MEGVDFREGTCPDLLAPTIEICMHFLAAWKAASAYDHVAPIPMYVVGLIRS